MKKLFTEGEVYTITMIVEWLEDVSEYRNETYVDYIKQTFPFISQIKENEGQYGLRRIAIEAGVIIDNAFEKLTPEEREALQHGWMGPYQSSHETDDGALGCYDFNVVPTMFQWWMVCMMTMEKMSGTVGIVTVEQAYDHIKSLVPPEPIRVEDADEREMLYAQL